MSFPCVTVISREGGVMTSLHLERTASFAFLAIGHKFEHTLPISFIFYFYFFIVLEKLLSSVVENKVLCSSL